MPKISIISLWYKTEKQKNLLSNLITHYDRHIFRTQNHCIFIRNKRQTKLAVKAFYFRLNLRYCNWMSPPTLTNNGIILRFPLTNIEHMTSITYWKAFTLMWSQSESSSVVDRAWKRQIICLKRLQKRQ